jgi:selenoprotein W-related protein
LTEELLERYSHAIESLTLLPSGGGRFEVVVGDDLVYSKKATGRHAEEGEVAKLFEEKTGAEAAEAE